MSVRSFDAEEPGRVPAKTNKHEMPHFVACVHCWLHKRNMLFRRIYGSMRGGRRTEEVVVTLLVQKLEEAAMNEVAIVAYI